jgi:hypothetical protein
MADPFIGLHGIGDYQSAQASLLFLGQQFGERPNVIRDAGFHPKLSDTTLGCDSGTRARPERCLGIMRTRALWLTKYPAIQRALGLLAALGAGEQTGCSLLVTWASAFFSNPSRGMCSASIFGGSRICCESITGLAADPNQSDRELGFSRGRNAMPNWS